MKQEQDYVNIVLITVPRNQQRVFVVFGSRTTSNIIKTVNRDFPAKVSNQYLYTVIQ